MRIIWIISVLVSILILVPVGTNQAFADHQVVCSTGQTPLVNLLAGGCIIAGDKEFHDWVLISQDGYDEANVQVIPVNDDPNNPGLRILTPGFDNSGLGSSEDRNFILQYDVTSLSSDLIKDFSIEIIESTGPNIQVQEFLLPFPFPLQIIASPSQLFVEAEFTPVQSITVNLVLRAGLGSSPASSLDEFVVLYSQLSQQTIGGTDIPIDQSALLLAGVQSISMWMIPVLIAGIGIGVFLIKRRK